MYKYYKIYKNIHINPFAKKISRTHGFVFYEHNRLSVMPKHVKNHNCPLFFQRGLYPNIM